MAKIKLTEAGQIYISVDCRKMYYLLLELKDNYDANSTEMAGIDIAELDAAISLMKKLVNNNSLTKLTS